MRLCDDSYRIPIGGRHGAKTYGSSTWNSRPVGAESAVPGAPARSRNLSTYHSNHQGRIRGKFRIAFPSTAPHGGKRLGRSRVARLRQQPPSKILPVDFGWARSAQG